MRENSQEAQDFLEQLRKLNSDELESLNAAYDVINYDVNIAANRAAQQAAYMDIRYTYAEDTAWVTVRNAGGDVGAINVAWDAALALEVKDLVGQYEFTREHYDALTGPVCKALPKLAPLFAIEDQAEPTS